jgi:hypothetical protein
VARAFRRVPRPAHLYWLSSASSTTKIARVRERALRVEQASGFLARPEETLYRSTRDGLPPGARVQLSGVQVRVLQALADGRPRSVQFEFDEPLESSRYLFRVYRRRALVPWRPPPIGSELTLPAEDFFRLVILELLRL